MRMYREYTVISVGSVHGQRQWVRNYPFVRPVGELDSPSFQSVSLPHCAGTEGVSSLSLPVAGVGWWGCVAQIGRVIQSCECPGDPRLSQAAFYRSCSCGLSFGPRYEENSSFWPLNDLQWEYLLFLLSSPQHIIAKIKQSDTSTFLKIWAVWL